jgi:hypothetical protein
MTTDFHDLTLATQSDGIDESGGGDDRRLIRLQLTQQIDATVFDQVSILTGERLVCQSIVNGFTEMDTFARLFNKIEHCRPPYEMKAKEPLYLDSSQKQDTDQYQQNRGR